MEKEVDKAKMLSEEIAWTRRLIDKFIQTPIPQRDELIARYLLFIAPEVDKKVVKNFAERNNSIVEFLKMLKNEGFD